LDALALRGRNVLGIVDLDSSRWGTSLNGVRVLGSEEVLLNHKADCIEVVNAVGCVDGAGAQKRKAVYDRLKQHGYRFAEVIHPAAVLAADIAIAEGAQILAGAIIQSGAVIGANTIINSGAIIEHDCRIGAHVHVASGAVLSGAVVVGGEAFIGAGAVVIHGMRVGARGVVGGGALVRQPVARGTTVIGVPARELKA
jgi:sugar O-acyltransferase (sialic acid O-acetyltransferase NeuD family)